MPTPPLKNVRKSNPYRPVFDDMSRAIRDHSIIQSGPGFGVYASPFGRMFRKTSQNWMVAMTTEDGLPAASYDADARELTLGKGDVLECTVDVDDAGDVKFVLAKSDDFGADAETAVTGVRVFNPKRSRIAGEEIVFLGKKFGLWIVSEVESEPLAVAIATTAVDGGSSIIAPGRGQAQIYRDGSPWGDPVLVLNVFSLPTPIAANSSLILGRIGDGWYVLAADCPS